MFQFFTGEEVIGDTVTITGSDVNHIRNVLRMKPGDLIRVCDVAGNTYQARIGSIDKDSVEALVTDRELSTNELATRVTLFQGLAKGEKMETIIQKAVELGVTEVVPVSMKNCVVKLDEKKAAKKVERYQAISESAAKQSKRSVIPRVSPVMTFVDALTKARSMDRILVPYEHASGMEDSRKAFESLRLNESVGIFIGPEGGFDPAEITALLMNKAEVFSLGSRILRTETAAICALSLVMYHLEVL
ncbi:MAG: 16S rRNA (uracil(1498)-N(3))-methyltransferase [Eubacterium sp.]|nr:16S rRNA (uracil(1498)-N(3))-methyltransferase [Eubacterium sp.]